MKVILTEKQYKMCLLEDVGEKYAEKAFNIKPEFSDFEDRYQKHQAKENREEIIFDNGAIVIIKNPKSLDNIGPRVRGVVDKDGNLYTEQKAKVIHHTIIEILKMKGILTANYNDWALELPTEFITVQRNKGTNEYEIGESHYPMRLTFERKGRKIRGHILWDDMPSYDYSEPIFNKFIQKANQKNSRIKFINRLTRNWD